ncbi:MAG: hypothetical protein IPM37_08660 [Hahellaceae bacterium]|nr:hypothetical protein [Hahellaceae bacterium]
MKKNENLLLIGLAVLIVGYESYTAFTADELQLTMASDMRLSSAGSYTLSSESLSPTPASPVRNVTPTVPARTATQAKTEQGIAAALERRYSELNQNADYPTLEQRVDEMQGRRDGQAFSPQSVVKLMEQGAVWLERDEPGPSLKLSDDERHDGRSFVQFEPTRIESLMAGDLLELPLPMEKATYTLLVESVEVGDHGDVTWNGRIAEFTNDNQVTITQGKQLTVAGITTPMGQYVLEARNGSGWIAAGGDLFKQDFEVTDEVAVKSNSQ